MSEYPCPVCANTMLPGVTYTWPRPADQRSPGKLYYPYTGAAMGLPPPPTLADCYNCKGAGVVEERRTGKSRRSAFFPGRRGGDRQPQPEVLP